MEVDAEDKVPTGLKRTRKRGARGGLKKKKPETAMEEARAAEAALVAQHVPE